MIDKLYSVLRTQGDKLLDKYENLPIAPNVNAPLGLLGQYKPMRRYLRKEQLLSFAESHYKNTRKGITVTDLLKNNLVKHKTQGQLLLKYAVRKGILFALERRRPQLYYPISLKSEIMKDYLSKITPKQVTGLPPNSSHPAILSSPDGIINQTLVGYVLPLMQTAPLYIHKLHLKTKVISQFYTELPVNADRHNKAKTYEENIGNSRVTYLFYPNGTIMVSIESSNTPFKLETEEDRSYILTFLGQVRDRLILIVCDSHERVVPRILKWELTQCDINKDIHVSDWLQFTGLKIQVSHLDHLFRIYIKSMGKETNCRVEESQSNINKTVSEALHDLFNPFERIENLINKRFDELTRK